jgi:membrane-associated phospholipid phosphatase
MNRRGANDIATARMSVFVLAVLFASAGVASAQCADVLPVPHVLAQHAPQTSDASVQESPSQDQRPHGQDPLPEAEKPTRGFVSAISHNLIDDVKHIPRRNSAYWLVGGTATALAVHPFDQTLNRRLVGSDTVGDAFIPGKYIGATETQIAASFATYIVGRTRHQPRVQHIGMDLLEAQLLTEGIVQVVKVAVQRERPLNPDGTRFSGYSFPSGHAAVTFASATVLQQHLGWRAAVPTYLLATYVAMSRLHDNEHYVSDVAFGAATGIIVGRSVTWHGRNNYTIAAVPMAGGLGVAIVW